MLPVDGIGEGHIEILPIAECGPGAVEVVEPRQRAPGFQNPRDAVLAPFQVHGLAHGIGMGKHAVGELGTQHHRVRPAFVIGRAPRAAACERSFKERKEVSIGGQPRRDEGSA